MSSDLSEKKLLPPLNFGDRPIFVNAKQHARILMRRAARQKLKAAWRQKVKSRSDLAKRRDRTQEGKFKKKGEEAQEAEEMTEMD